MSDGNAGKFNVPAIIAMVLPFVCLMPFGIAFSIVGIVQTKDGKMRGRGLAVTALIVNLVFLATCGVGVALAPDHEEDHAEREVVTKENAHRIANELEREIDADK